MAEFVLADSFDCDDGSLVGIALHVIFAMGVEWEMFRERLKIDPKSFIYPCISGNATRLQDLAARKHRNAECRSMGVEGWSEVWVSEFREES